MAFFALGKFEWANRIDYEFGNHTHRKVADRLHLSAHFGSGVFRIACERRTHGYKTAHEREPESVKKEGEKS